MGKPGSGRYTTYVPVKSDKTDRLQKLFSNGLANLYNGKDSNDQAAVEAVNIAKSVLTGKGDQDMFGNGVSLSFGEAPDTTVVAWKNPGDPANPYVPDLSSPGPGKTEGVDKDADPKLSPEDIKPNFNSKNPSVNATAPAATAPRLGSISLGEELQKGKSSVV
jgi:hypothetical protein